MTPIDPGVVSLVAESARPRAAGREELGQWKAHHEERRVIDASQAATNRMRAMVSLPRYSAPMPRPPTGDRGWMA